MRLERVGYGREPATFGYVEPYRIVLGTEHALAHTDAALLATTSTTSFRSWFHADAPVAGALDVWTAPVQMKKGRPGVEITAVARPEAEQAVARVLLTHTTTLGVRVAHVRRHELERAFREVEVDGHRVRVKLGGGIAGHNGLRSVTALGNRAERPSREVVKSDAPQRRGSGRRSLIPTLDDPERPGEHRERHRCARAASTRPWLPRAPFASSASAVGGDRLAGAATGELMGLPSRGRSASPTRHPDR